MERRWRVAPDQALQIGDEIVHVVSRSAMVEAIMDGEAFLARSGGMLTVVVGRRQTGFPGEAVTTDALIEWKDGPNAKLRPEHEGSLLQATGNEPTRPVPVEPELPPEAPPVAAEPAAVAGLAEAATAHVPADDIGDGLDPETLEDEDVSALEGAIT